MLDTVWATILLLTVPIHWATTNPAYSHAIGCVVVRNPICYCFLHRLESCNNCSLSSVRSAHLKFNVLIFVLPPLKPLQWCSTIWCPWSHLQYPFVCVCALLSRRTALSLPPRQLNPLFVAVFKGTASTFTRNVWTARHLVISLIVSLVYCASRQH